MFNYLKIAVAVSLLVSVQSFAQQTSNIFIGKLNIEAKNPVTELVQLTNTPTYTNQPMFFENNYLFYTQAPSKESEQTDIFMFDFATSEHKNLTMSDSSEYSPTPLPYGPGFSVVNVNAENKQELWELDPQGNHKTHLAPNIEPVGYHLWINNNELLLFVLGEPHTLVRVHKAMPESDAVLIDSNIGASIIRFLDSDWVLYTSSNEGNFLNAYNIKTNEVDQLFLMPEGAEYFSLTPNGVLLTSDNKTLWQKPLKLKNNRVTWLVDFEPILIEEPSCASGISRTHTSPDMSMIALVCNDLDE